MDRSRKDEGFLEKTAQVFGIPGETVGLPRVELTGRHELRMENHKGILAYGREEIHISGGIYLIKVMGQELELRAMTGLELLITGKISQITLA